MATSLNYTFRRVNVNGFEMIEYEKDFYKIDYHRVTFVKAL
ncbi:hypothetical protein [Paenibacillus agricola]|nr:hypothetical protein [Paenibacillus agricola]